MWRGIYCIYRKELKAFFSSSVAYVIITSFLVLMGNFFYGTIADYQRSAVQYYYPVEHLNVNDMIVRPTFYNLCVLLLFVVPIITMRSFAEEKKTSTLEFLQTSPVSSMEIVLGKYLGALTFFLIMCSSTLLYIVLLKVFGSLEIGPVVSGYLGVTLLGGLFIAVGLLCSSFTENQVVAAVLTFGIFLLLWILGWVGEQMQSQFSQGIEALSVLDHLYNIVQGVIDTKDIVYFLSGILFFIFLTNLSLQY